MSDDEIVDAYLYLLGRFIVVRQENHDIRVEQAGYNVVKYNPVGAEAAEFVNPNLDVAYLEAWIAERLAEPLAGPPAAPQPNWLPTPAGQGFALTLRLYVSKPEVIDGPWFPPPLTTR